jgi:hypothetical protein
MGIDAEMYVLVPEADATRENITRASHWLFEYFGPDKFFGYDKRGIIYLPKVFLHDEEGEEIGEGTPGSRVQQDGPDEVAPEGKVFLRVALWSRYYGVDYERGDFVFLYMLARALEAQFPRGQVWYGGDSSGVLAQPFGHEEREALLAHFLAGGRKAYTDYFDHDKHGPKCRTCDVRMTRYGWGGNYAAYSCPCGERHETRDGVLKVTTREERREEKLAAKRDVEAAIEELGDPALSARARQALWGDDR